MVVRRGRQELSWDWWQGRRFSLQIHRLFAAPCREWNWQGGQQQTSDRLEILLLGLVELLPCGLCLLDAHGRRLFSNPGWDHPDRAAGSLNFTSRVKTVTRKAGWMPASWSFQQREHVWRAVNEVLDGHGRCRVVEHSCDDSCSTRSYVTRVIRLPRSSGAAVCLINEDISRLRQAEKARHTDVANLRQISAHMESRRETQQAWVARELHDEVGAVLTLLRLELAGLRLQLGAASPISARLDEMVSRVCDAQQEVRRLSSSLRPALLDSLGLMTTLRWYIRRFAGTTGIELTLTLPEYVRLSVPAATAIFRIIQEALTNIASHSGADSVGVTVDKVDGWLRVEITDNGCGIAAERLEHPESFGLSGMRERASHFGGQLDISGLPGKGTRIAVSIPLSC